MPVFVYEMRWSSSCGSVARADGGRWELVAAKTSQRWLLASHDDILAYCRDERYVAWLSAFLGVALALVDHVGSESNPVEQTAPDRAAGLRLENECQSGSRC